ncbi:4-amino-4-deoxychorismate lyase [Allocatelliglobosispora scoriae]|uniref:4-amino-4-deoxychorismate lyase n=1 Tax=Allocatelliglobosispora scoriae TaxID=643052 RepID=A0A841BNG3_9ACTN|nr:4-amino-4-deoxychorismate lyase [Allocatelliglobosispora scoriae]
MRGAEPFLLNEHLSRMVRSAARMELALPPVEELVKLAAQACDGWDPAVEGALRLTCTRGPEATGEVTCYAILTAVGAASKAARARGLNVAGITLGFPAAIRTDAPWLLGGVKSLSYAVNMASQRWATANGLDDVLWLSADGFVLEAPTSTVVWRDGDALCTVPVSSTGILPGTTARHLLDNAGALGLTAEERMVTTASLTAASGVWLLSSVRGCAPIHTIDGVALAPSPDTVRIQTLLGFHAPE